MKNAKKILCIFLSVSIIYCSFLNVPVVSASAIEFGESKADLPTVYELGGVYDVQTASAGVIGLTSSIIGGVTTLTGSSALVSGLLATGVVALGIGGAYVVGSGLYNLYNNAVDWYTDQESLNALQLNVKFDDLGNMSLVSSLFNKFVNSFQGVLPSVTDNKTYTYGSHNLTFPNFLTATRDSISYYFCYPMSGYSCAQSNFSQYMMFSYNGIDYLAKRFHFNTQSTTPEVYVQDAYFLENGSWSKKSFYIPAGTVNSKGGVDIDIAGALGNIKPVTTAQFAQIYETYNNYGQSVALDVPNNYITALNPSLNWNGNTWVDKNTGEDVPPKDITIPFPNVLGDAGVSYDDALDNAINDSVSSGDTTIPDSGSGSLPSIDFSSITDFLSSILDWLLAFPSWLVTNLVNVITGAITSVSDVIGNIWSWCQDLPNVLADVLSGIIEFLQSIGMTLADILAFVISLPLELVNALIDMFVSLFVPSEGFFVSSFENILNNLELKFPFFAQIRDFFLTLNPFSPSEPPSIKITLPDFFGGGTYNFVDFYFFDKYRNYYLSLVRLFLWIFALKHIYRRLPSLVSGGGSL